MSDDITKEIVQLTKEMVKFKSTKDNLDELRNVVGFVKDYFKDTGLVIQEFERADKPSVLISFEKTLTPQLLLIGHLDVVEGKERQFTAEERDGKLWGRGTDDMKGQNAVLMVLMKHLVASKDKRNVMLALTTDEEIGGQNGAKYLVEQGLKPEIALAPDGGTDMGVVTKEKGILHLKLGFKGKACHGSRPWLGENAIDKAILAYQHIKEKFPPTTPDNRWKRTCNIGIIKGGEAPNKVADWAEIAIDIRYTGDDTEEALLAMVKELTADAGEVSVEIISSGAPLDTADDDPWIVSFRKCSAEVLGKELPLDLAHGASDIRHLADVGIPGFLCAIPGEGAHGPEEYLYIDEIEPFYRILEKFVLEHVAKL